MNLFLSLQIQFAIILSYAVALLVNDCPLPKALNWIMAFQSTVFSLLFANFYYKAYVRSPTKKLKQQDDEAREKQRQFEKHQQMLNNNNNNNNITPPEELAKKVVNFTQSWVEYKWVGLIQLQSKSPNLCDWFLFSTIAGCSRTKWFFFFTFGRKLSCRILKISIQPDDVRWFC